MRIHKMLQKRLHMGWVAIHIVRGPRFSPCVCKSKMKKAQGRGDRVVQRA